MAAKEPRRDFRTNEEAYFRLKDVELIEKIRERERATQELCQRETHRGRCGHCGAGLQEWTYGSLQGHVCATCGHVELSFETLERMVKEKTGRSAVADIERVFQSSMRRAG
jgi:hypothetical protein